MNIYDTLINRALNGGGGGGGSGAFVQAEITCNAASKSFAPLVTLKDDLTNNGINTGFYVTNADGVTMSEPFGSISQGESQTVLAYVMKNHVICFIDSTFSTSDYAVTGNAEVKTISEGGATYYYVEIFGDCTITV